MDARSPPPHAKEIIASCLASYRALLDRVDAKIKAVARLEQRPPASIQTKMDLRLSSALLAASPDVAAGLQAQFAAGLAQRSADLHAIVLHAAQAELQQLRAATNACVPNAVAELKTYFETCSAAASNVTVPHSVPHPPPAGANPPDPNEPVQPHGPADPMGPADSSPPHQARAAHTDSLRVLCAGGLDINLIFYNDYVLSVEFLNSACTKLHYQRLLAATAAEAKAAKKAAAKTAAEAMEVDLPNDLLVAQLVKREIGKSTAVLRKELNQLRASLKAATSRPGGPTGMNNKTSSPPPPRGGENPRGGPAGSKYNKNKNGNDNGRAAKPAAAAKDAPSKPKKARKIMQTAKKPKSSKKTSA
ncbi:hypothetical protein DYB36_013182 [Aphanomyces astaci]|uniref:Uncharacterized protein n=1 Tax=Aphanomyces astaci TaxID=112090 RepID=A0A397AGC3_APHAT|nr:hypothetical protein DYB36_013182 [Aphanomyces astaci]